jgi:peptidoglycan hydrolase FlgJ
METIAFGRTEALSGAAQGKGGIDPRLQPAAHQFEAIMMEQLLKPMEKDPLFQDSLFSGQGGGAGLVAGDAGSGTWSSLGVESLARAISDAGGLGVAKQVIEEVEAEAKAEGDGPARTSTTGSMSKVRYPARRLP